VEGEVIEERLVLGGAPIRLHHRAGEVFDFDAAHVHRMRQDSDAPAVSIHAYSPPLWRMGAYAVGSVHRTGARSGSPVQNMLPLVMKQRAPIILRSVIDGADIKARRTRAASASS